jgi:hypothetical protein
MFLKIPVSIYFQSDFTNGRNIRLQDRTAYCPRSLGIQRHDINISKALLGEDPILCRLGNLCYGVCFPQVPLLHFRE